MKIKVVGLERSEGVSKKTNRPYTVGQVHAVVSLEQRSDASSMSKGAMGTTYRVDPEVIKRVEHLPLPFEAEILVEDVMRYGERETKVMDLRPVGVAPAMAPVQKAA